MEIRVTNADEAETTLNMSGIVSEYIDDDIVVVESDEYFTALDLLTDEFLLQELVEFSHLGD